jgi:hypothetical protein
MTDRKIYKALKKLVGTRIPEREGNYFKVTEIFEEIKVKFFVVEEGRHELMAEAQFDSIWGLFYYSDFDCFTREQIVKIIEKAKPIKVANDIKRQKNSEEEKKKTKSEISDLINSL